MLKGMGGALSAAGLNAKMALASTGKSQPPNVVFIIVNEVESTSPGLHGQLGNRYSESGQTGGRRDADASYLGKHPGMTLNGMAWKFSMNCVPDQGDY